MIIGSFVKDCIGGINEKTFIEVGCGTGFVLSSLKKMGFMVTGVDMHKTSIKLAAKRTGARFFQTRLERMSTKEKFDVLGAFDVLEHVEDEKKFLKKCGRLIKKNGTIILTVPARKELWSKIDEFSGHKRRYDKIALISLLKECCLKVQRIDYFGFFLFFPQWIARKYQDTKMDKVKGKRALNFIKKTIKPRLF